MFYDLRNILYLILYIAHKGNEALEKESKAPQQDEKIQFEIVLQVLLQEFVFLKQISSLFAFLMYLIFFCLLLHFEFLSLQKT